ncbi:MAG: hypothetical protein M1833_004328 [Piccolia ochrophora]|nr:MAG: hypothetical protein M1833_004328 [Piccolia ochrophora]
MECELLPATVYQPEQPGQARSRKLNTIIEEIQSQSLIATATHHGRSSSDGTSNDPSTFISPLSDDFPTPRAHGFIARSASPSSSIDSASFTWASSDYENTRDSGTDFDDMDDVSDEEADKDGATVPVVLVRRPRSYAISESQSRDSSCSMEIRRRVPSLVIPSPSQWPGPPSFMKNAAVPPTPPSKVAISPAALSLLTQDLPTSPNPPSLDGSLNSEQLAASTAPPTPLIGTGEGDDSRWDGGVQLNPEALATLQFLSGNNETPAETPIEISRVTEMREAPPAVRQNSDETVTPSTHRSLESLTKLDIPSPGGFFSSLAPATRHTWCPSSAGPPSSTTAEQFYNCPWNAPTERTLEQVIEVNESGTDGPPTAQMDTPRAPKPSEEEEDDLEITEVHVDHDTQYEDTLRESGLANLSRTSIWLSTQESYMSTLREAINPSTPHSILRQEDVAAETSPGLASPGKKSVKFSDEVNDIEDMSGDVSPCKKESVFLHGLQYVIGKSGSLDSFVHSNVRFDAIQTKRICAAVAHRDHLLGKYVPFEKQQAEENPTTIISKRTEKAEKERDALDQMNAATWNIMATKMLNGGKLLSSPAVKRMERSNRCDSTILNRTRVLDLGGQSICDWAWHCAEQYPNAKVYTVVAKTLRQSTHSNMRGPPNHRQVAVPCMWKLPFPDNYFEVVSARSLYMLLKTDRPSEELDDEYDLCLRECMRCLKPGGYLEYSLFDSDIMNAGPLGSAMAVEFGFNLKTRGYDPTPSRGWLGRLNKAGFGSTKRAWVVLPMGAPTGKSIVPAKRDIESTHKAGSIDSHGTEDEMMGSTSGAANITGLVGSWAWEKWMLKLQMESGKNQDHLLEGVPAALTSMLFFSFFKTLVDHEVTVELKNDISIRGILKSVDQFLNIKLDDIQVVEELKYPHLSSVKNIFIRGSVVRYVHLPGSAVDTALLEDATRREAAQQATKAR